MEATDSYDPEVLSALRGRMVASALRKGLGWHDAEDVVQEALLKAVREHVRPGAPPLPARAFTALHDRHVEFVRRSARQRKREVPTEHLEEAEVAKVEMGVNEDPRLRLLELCLVVSAIAGSDAMRFAQLKSEGATEHDVAALIGPRRAAAARRRLAKKKAAIAQALLAGLSPEEGPR